MKPSLRLIRLATLVIVALTLTDCVPMRVNSFLERGSDFTRYRTYTWAPDDELVTGDPRLDNNPFFLERLQADVDAQLAARGFEKITAGTPELLLHYHVRIDQQLDANNADQKYGYYDNCEPYVYDAGTILLDFVDARTRKLVWRGWAEGTMEGFIDNQDWMEERIDEAVTRILARLTRSVGDRCGDDDCAGRPSPDPRWRQRAVLEIGLSSRAPLRAGSEMAEDDRRTISTEHDAWRLTASATLPNSNLSRPLRP
jgi:hypothetical protein